MLAACLLARDLRWDLACAEGAHLRAEGVEFPIVLHCMNEHGARGPPWRREASCDLSIAGRIACCALKRGPPRCRPSLPNRLCADRAGVASSEPLVAAPAAQQWPMAASTITIPAAACDS